MTTTNAPLIYTLADVSRSKCRNCGRPLGTTQERREGLCRQCQEDVAWQQHELDYQRSVEARDDRMTLLAGLHS